MNNKDKFKLIGAGIIFSLTALSIIGLQSINNVSLKRSKAYETTIILKPQEDSKIPLKFYYEGKTEISSFTALPTQTSEKPECQMPGIPSSSASCWANGSKAYVTLEWREIPETLSYLLEVDLNPNFTNPVRKSVPGHSTSIILDNPSVPRHFRIRIEKSAICSAPSQWSFVYGPISFCEENTNNNQNTPVDPKGLKVADFNTTGKYENTFEDL